MSDDVRKENEEYYDKEIAPLLSELAKKCDAKGMGFIGAVENKGDVYRTILMRDKINPAIRIIYYAVRALGNVDNLFMSIEKDAKEYGHNSAYLMMLENYRKKSD